MDDTSAWYVAYHCLERHVRLVLRIFKHVPHLSCPSSYHTYETMPQVNYPEGFQGNNIPVDGPSIAQIIEERVASILV